MKITDTIYFRKFKGKKTNFKIIRIFKKVLDDENNLLNSLKSTYKDSYSSKVIISKYKKYLDINVIGMGGSILGSSSIFSFLKHKIKKKFTFIDNLEAQKIQNLDKRKKLNLIISKSGNTLETITNSNIILKKNSKNIFITEKKDSYLLRLAGKLKSDIVEHNNFIGGRYSVLSEVGMLPADLMGLNPKKFRQFNDLIKNKKFTKSLLKNVSNILDFERKKKTNSIVLNYDEKSSELFFWYQQLMAESLGKKNKGILPIISNMPKDNHSLMQLYLSGLKNNFFTFFFVKEKISKKINNQNLLNSHKFLKKKSINDIKFAQFMATQKVFDKSKIPYRSFLLDKRDETTLGQLFTFFILETILLGKAMKVNPFDQPSVELIKKETKNFFI